MTKTITSAQSELPAIMDKPTFVKAIVAVQQAAAKVQAQVQAIGVQALMHLEAHGDIGSVNRFYLGMPNGIRKNALASWLIAHGALRINDDAGTKATSPMVYEKTKKTNALAALNDPWQDHMPEKALDEVFDLSQALNRIFAKAKGKKVMMDGVLLTEEDTAKNLAALKTFAKAKAAA